MELLSLALQYEIEKELVQTLLDSALRERGSEKEFARQVGLTPIHLSYLRAAKRMPSVQTAKRIANALACTDEQREGFVHHVAQAWRLKNSLRRMTQRIMPGRPAQHMVDMVRAAQNDATFARDGATAQMLYRRVRTLSELLLDLTDPNQDALNFVELSFVAHDALCVLNRSDEALWHAKRARVVTPFIESNRSNQERVDFVRVNALRCEAVALHNLKLARPMQAICDQVEVAGEFKRNEAFWRPLVNRDKIQALEDTPRFSIREAEEYARQVFRLCDRRANSTDPLMTLLVSQSLTRAYIKRGNFEKAHHILVNQLNGLDSIPQMGPLHRVIFFKTFALWYWTQGSRGDEWRYFLKQAFELGTEAGLTHQLDELRRDFGGINFAEQ